MRAQVSRKKESDHLWSTFSMLASQPVGHINKVIINELSDEDELLDRTVSEENELRSEGGNVCCEASIAMNGLQRVTV